MTAVTLAPQHEIHLEYGCGCRESWRVYSPLEPEVLVCPVNCRLDVCGQCHGTRACPARLPEPHYGDDSKSVEELAEVAGPAVRRKWRKL